MKQINFLLSLATVFIFSTLIAQTNVNLNLNHRWNGEVFNYGQEYTDDSGNMVEISRVQYYLSGFNLTHNGGQTIPLNSTYLLASANITTYSLGSLALTDLDSISFDVGVDSATNHLDPNSYTLNHPLGLQSPSMHWGWNAGYRFLVIEGKVDANGDNIAEKRFEFHVTASDSYLTSVVPISTSGSSNGTDLTIDLYVNIADWLSGIDLTTAGFNHGVYLLNGTVMQNTNTNLVFKAEETVGITDYVDEQENVYFNYSAPYAPTIFYKFPLEQQVELSITDLNGKLIVKEDALSSSGNYFINKELAKGTYIAVFKTGSNNMISKKFIIQ